MKNEMKLKNLKIQFFLKKLNSGIYGIIDHKKYARIEFVNGFFKGCKKEV